MFLLRDPEDPRRRTLLQLLSLGMLGTTGTRSLLAADIAGLRPDVLPPGRSIYSLSDEVTVNGVPATVQTRIGPTDTVATGTTGEIAFAVSDSAFILRKSSRVELSQRRDGNLLSDGLRLLSGALLAVFPRQRPRYVTTLTATIGIRGTGVYVETDPEQTYFCTCYGVTDVRASNDAQSARTVESRHHDEPLYILARAPEGRSIRRAPFINHTDQELALIEALVGREPPFVFPSEDYGGVRRPYE
jgi:hypothetical protein